MAKVFKQVSSAKIASRREPPSSKPPALLASSKLSEARIKRAIDCFAKDLPVAEAMRQCAISHVTAYRIYKHIRARLWHLQVFPTPKRYAEERDAEEKEDGYFSGWDVAEKAIGRAMGAHRGIRPHNREIYLALERYRYDTTLTPTQLSRVIILSTKDLGPLNRPPLKARSYHVDRELLRVLMAGLRASVSSALVEPESEESLAVKDSLDQMEASADKTLARVHRKGTKRQR